MCFRIITDNKIKVSTLKLSIIFWLVAFQNIWERFVFAAKAIDELFAIVLVSVCVALKRKQDKFSISILLGLSLYAIAGFCGNLIYSYQSWGYVLIDFVTNI